MTVMFTGHSKIVAPQNGTYLLPPIWGQFWKLLLYFLKIRGPLASLRAGQPRNCGFDLGQGHEIYPLSKASRPAVGYMQPPIQWVPWHLSAGVKRPL